MIELLVRGTALLLLAHGTLWLLRRRSAAIREMAGRWLVVSLWALPLLTVAGPSLEVLPDLWPAGPIQVPA